ncbi:hypothetical protein K7711_46430 [Nocardia sp. CA2R105]|uniref:hypothetical protein n=1 Tax=Nocardia coffeae TaxID=2873381 RepID=UPI001CA7AFE9|nr:hypothetical protein [Nocardia coffeae]MBY8863971.1 hypothetical protein [Nocardia coffeae]
MLSVIAAADQPRGAALVDWLPVLAPLGVIAAAIIAATVARWNDHKAPHEQLETLVKIYRDWPQELEGKDTIERQIALRLAEIRVADEDGEQPEASAEERAAEQRVLTRARRLLFNRAFGSGFVASSLVIGILTSLIWGEHTPVWVTVLEMLILVTGVVIYMLSPRTRVLYQLFRQSWVQFSGHSRTR